MEDKLHEDFIYSEAGLALKNLLYQLVDVKKKRLKKIVYNGPEILSSSVLATSHNISDSFSKEHIADKKEYGKDVIDIFINKVFQLGMSVGVEKEYNRLWPLCIMLRGQLIKKKK